MVLVELHEHLYLLKGNTEDTLTNVCSSDMADAIIETSFENGPRKLVFELGYFPYYGSLQPPSSGRPTTP